MFKVIVTPRAWRDFFKIFDISSTTARTRSRVFAVHCWTTPGCWRSSQHRRKDFLAVAQVSPQLPKIAGHNPANIFNFLLTPVPSTTYRHFFLPLRRHSAHPRSILLSVGGSSLNRLETSYENHEKHQNHTADSALQLLYFGFWIPSSPHPKFSILPTGKTSPFNLEEKHIWPRKSTTINSGPLAVSSILIFTAHTSFAITAIRLSALSSQPFKPRHPLRANSQTPRSASRKLSPPPPRSPSPFVTMVEYQWKCACLGRPAGNQ